MVPENGATIRPFEKTPHFAPKQEVQPGLDAVCGRSTPIRSLVMNRAHARGMMIHDTNPLTSRQVSPDDFFTPLEET